MAVMLYVNRVNSGNPEMGILSQATKGNNGFVEGASTTRVSPNNNLSHERPKPYMGYEIVRAYRKKNCMKDGIKSLSDNINRKLTSHNSLNWGLVRLSAEYV